MSTLEKGDCNNMEKIKIISKIDCFKTEIKPRTIPALKRGSLWAATCNPGKSSFKALYQALMFPQTWIYTNVHCK